MKELAKSDIQDVSGGIAPWAIIVGIGAYGSALETAWTFGEGLGSGLYDAFHP